MNVRNPAAGGDLLSCDEVLSVFVAWVRYDAVTARFARPWCWRDHYCAPLHATGAEPAEPAWDASPTVEAWTAEATDSSAAARATRRVHQHLPAFVRAAHAAVHAADFAALSEADQVERLVAASGAAVVRASCWRPRQCLGALPARWRRLTTLQRAVQAVQLMRC